MKKLLIVLSFICLPLTLAGCADGFWDTPTTNDLMSPDANYEIDTWGANSEIYEFTPTTAKHMTCVMFMLDSGEAMGLDCFPKQ
jgi:hypothetical protein